MDPDECKRFDQETGTHPFEPCHMPCPWCGYGEHSYEVNWNSLTGKREGRCARCDKEWPYGEVHPQVTVCEARERG